MTAGVRLGRPMLVDQVEVSAGPDGFVVALIHWDQVVVRMALPRPPEPVHVCATVPDELVIDGHTYRLHEPPDIDDRDDTDPEC